MRLVNVLTSDLRQRKFPGLTFPEFKREFPTHEMMNKRVAEIKLEIVRKLDQIPAK